MNDKQTDTPIDEELVEAVERGELQPREVSSEEMEELGIDVAYAELLLFRIGGMRLLIRVGDVAEIIRPLELTPVPMAPDHLLGMANVRGQPTCIIDPCELMELPEGRSEESDQTRFMIFRHPRMHVGMWVDEVMDLYRVREEVVPELDPEETDLVFGEVETGGGRFPLLNNRAILQ